MRFVLELRCNTCRYRLQQDGGWREIEPSAALESSDYQTEDSSDIVQRWMRNELLELGGETWRVNPASCGSPEKAANLGCRVFRTEAPKTPSIASLKACMAGGDASCANTLIVTIDGEYELRPVPPFDHQAANPTVVIRHDTYSAGGYVGPAAAADDGFLEQEHAATLEHWLAHLEHGALDIYVDLPAEGSIRELELEIGKLIEKWRPRY